ncbi:hypothetical protein L596_014471 [Steinernema carpocapsae]|uniref:Uncharacterized protein n=1 Tax=Steinernema carpocapsae TaxID=34508 RepID=A0A4U5ND35_STECR|nr:hypothetical protein L596_014471 [Steinernema carpocapsae]
MIRSRHPAPARSRSFFGPPCSVAPVKSDDRKSRLSTLSIDAHRSNLSAYINAVLFNEERIAVLSGSTSSRPAAPTGPRGLTTSGSGRSSSTTWAWHSMMSVQLTNDRQCLVSSTTSG